jgi:hypothetical protein
MFIRPDSRADELLSNHLLLDFLPVFQPLFGQDFYVTIEDFRAYVKAVMDFWTELAGILENQELE